MTPDKYKVLINYDPEFVHNDTDDHGDQSGQFIVPLSDMSEEDLTKLGLNLPAPEHATHVACDVNIEKEWGPNWSYARVYYSTAVPVTVYQYTEIE